jgi:hypothetical protein
MAELITSAKNPKFKNLLLLQEKSKARREQGLFVVEGRRELEHCLEAGYNVHTIFVCPEIAGAETEEVVYSKPMATLGHVRGRGPQEHLEESDAWEGSRSDDLETPVPAGKSSASSRIHVADTAGMGLPEAVIRIACSKGTYIRAFARDLGEALGSGAHLGGLIRSRSGDYTIKDALQVEDALDLLAP